MSVVEQSLPPPREAAPTSQQQEVEDQKSSYRDSLPGAPKPMCSGESYDEAIFDEFYDDMISQPTKNSEVAEAPPALPEKSALRASRFLDGFGLKLPAPEPLAQTTPHDLYLSSEEDASSSADDFSDYDFDSGSEEPSKLPRRRSHEDTARVVSVVYSGKPSIIDVSVIRRSISPNSNAARRQGSQGSLSTDSSLSRRISASSSAGSGFGLPRSATMPITEMGRLRPQFLSIDPFAAKTEEEPNEEKTPRTPTAVFRRTLSLVKKRSRPILNNLANGSRDALASPSIHGSSSEQLPDIQAESKPAPQLPVTYHEILRVAKRNATSTPSTPLSPVPQSPLSPGGTKSRILSTFSMGRRRSVKAG